MSAAALSGENAAPYALAGLIAIISTFCLTLWACAGSAIAGLLRNPDARAWFNRVMGGLLMASAVLLVL